MAYNRKPKECDLCRQTLLPGRVHEVTDCIEFLGAENQRLQSRVDYLESKIERILDQNDLNCKAYD